MPEQNYANHAKRVPLFIFFLSPVFSLNFAWAVYHFVKIPSWAAGMYALVGAALMVQLVLQRTFALRVQDRVIRLEEQLRYERLLSPELRARCGGLGIDQVVSLRFASDAELPELARRVLDEKLQDRKKIKQLIKNWKADE